MMHRNKHWTPRRQRYAKFVNWVRKTHGWIGLWGAMLGLIFGLSGIWLNHRTVLKLPPVAQVRANTQVQLPDLPPASPEEMSLWLQAALLVKDRPNSIRIEPSRPVAWTPVAPSSTTTLQSPSDTPAVRILVQPERWLLNFGGPNELTQADYWVGNKFVSVNTVSNGFLATLTNLHKGTGMSIPWILLIDSFAGSMIFLSLSGVLLWVQMNRRRAVGLTIFSASMTLIVTLIGLRL